MRRGRGLAVVVAAALVAAGCSSDDDPEVADTDTQTEETTTTADGGAAAEGGTLVVAISSDPGQLNPAITTSGGVHTASELFFNGLVDLDENLEPVPELAESWEVEEDGALYRFHLRDDVTWHDGTPFTAADVKFSFEEVLLDLHSRTKASVGASIESIEAPDDLTVEFRFAQPYAPLLQQLNVTEAPIVPRHIYEGTDPMTNPANLEPIGTGPFRFVSYMTGSEIRMEKNTDYFEDGLPLLDEVVMRVIPEEGSRVVALEAGDVDWLFETPGPDLDRLRSSGDFDFLETPVNPGGANCIMTVSFNLDRPIFNDVRVREAIGHALDREQFVERVLFGQGSVAEAPISSGIPFAHGDVELPGFDAEEAARLLDEAGWGQDGDGIRTAQGVEGVDDGTALAFDFLHFPTFTPYAELLRAQLREVGAEVTLEPLEPPVFAETVFTNRDFDTNIISYCNATDPEIGVRRMFTTSNIGPVPFSNSSAYRNDRVDALFDEAQATVSIDERTDIYQQIQEIVAAELPYLWIVETVAVRTFDADCRDFGPSGHFAETASCER